MGNDIVDSKTLKKITALLEERCKTIGKQLVTISLEEDSDEDNGKCVISGSIQFTAENKK